MKNIGLYPSTLWCQKRKQETSTNRLSGKKEKIVSRGHTVGLIVF